MPAAIESTNGESRHLIRATISNVGSKSNAVFLSIHDRVKQYSLFSNALDKFDCVLAKTTNVAQNLYSYVSPVVDKVVDATDKLIDVPLNIAGNVVGKARRSAALVVPASWLQSVDKLLLTNINMDFAFGVFVSAGHDVYVSLSNTASGANVRFEQFLAELKQKLTKAWDERLTEPSRALYEKLREGYEEIKKADVVVSIDNLVSNIRKKLIEYESTVVSVFKEKLARPALALYNAAVDQYNIITAMGGSPPSLQVFLESMQKRLGASYTSNLEQPLRQFFAAAHSNMAHAQASLDFDNDGKLTLHDLFYKASSLTQNLIANTASAVDRFVPEESSDDSKSSSSSSSSKPQNLTQLVSLISSRISKKVSTRVESLRTFSSSKYEQLRQFSSTRGKEALGFDVVEQGEVLLGKAEKMVLDANARGKKALEPVTIALGQSLVYIHQRLELALAEPHLVHLNNKIHAALNASLELLQLWSHYVLYTSVLDFPYDAFALVRHIPLLLAGGKDEEFAQGLEKIHAVLNAVKAIFDWTDYVAPAVASSSSSSLPASTPALTSSASVDSSSSSTSKDSLPSSSPALFLPQSSVASLAADSSPVPVSSYESSPPSSPLKQTSLASDDE